MPLTKEKYINRVSALHEARAICRAIKDAQPRFLRAMTLP